VLFDRSWYNRAGVEHVMGFCTPQEYADFLTDAPDFERMLLRDGMILIKFWFSVSRGEQLSLKRRQGIARDVAHAQLRSGTREEHSGSATDAARRASNDDQLVREFAARCALAQLTLRFQPDSSTHAN